MVHIDRVIPHDAGACARVVVKKMSIRARSWCLLLARMMKSVTGNASQQPLRAVGETVRVKKMSCAHGKPGDRRFR